MSIKSEKLSHTFVEEISSIIREEVKDKRNYLSEWDCVITQNLKFMD